MEIIWFSYSNHCLSINLEIFMKIWMYSIPPAPYMREVECVCQWLARTWFRKSLFGSDSCLYFTRLRFFLAPDSFRHSLKCAFLRGDWLSVLMALWTAREWYRCYAPGGAQTVPVNAVGHSGFRIIPLRWETVTFGCRVLRSRYTPAVW